VGRAPPTRGHLGREGRLGQPRGRGLVERGRVSQPKAKAQAAGPKTGAGPNSRNKTFSNFIWNSDFWQTLEICTRRFRRDFDMRIFPKIF
jgi:hypothetical protein